MHRHFGAHMDRAWRSRHGWAGRMGERAERHRGRARGFGRFFEHGDLRFVVLALLAEQPRHGYELIKELEDRTGGAYRPSPGVIYPTLSLLEDEVFVTQANPDAGRKLYEITEAGRAALSENQAAVDAVFARISQAG